MPGTIFEELSGGIDFGGLSGGIDFGGLSGGIDFGGLSGGWSLPGYVPILNSSTATINPPYPSISGFETNSLVFSWNNNSLPQIGLTAYDWLVQNFDGKIININPTYFNLLNGYEQSITYDINWHAIRPFFVGADSITAMLMFGSGDLVNLFNIEIKKPTEFNAVWVGPEVPENILFTYFNPRKGDITEARAIDSWIFSDYSLESTLRWESLDGKISFARNWYNAPFSSYPTVIWHNSVLVHNGSCSSAHYSLVGGTTYEKDVWDKVWLKFNGSGSATVRVISDSNPNSFVDLSFFIREDPLVIPTWEAESSLTSYNPSLLQFRHDLRNSLYQSLNQIVRESIADSMPDYMRLYNEKDQQSFNIMMSTNNDRVERIDDYIKQIEFNTEKALNAISDQQIQSMYASIYRTLQDYDSKLKEFIDSTLKTSVENYQLSTELVAQLQQKINTETLVQYSTTVNNLDSSKLQAILHTQSTNDAWDITQYIANKGGQLMLTLPSISQITGLTQIDSFVPWYIYIWPRSRQVSGYIIPTSRRIQFSTTEDLTEVIWGNLYDINGQSYKIVNKEGDSWILDKNIESNVIGTPLTFYPNFFDPQIIKIDIAWLHNYIPKNVPLGTTWRPPVAPVIVPIIPPAVVPSETVVIPIPKENNKEIF